MGRQARARHGGNGSGDGVLRHLATAAHGVLVALELLPGTIRAAAISADGVVLLRHREEFDVTEPVTELTARLERCAVLVAAGNQVAGCAVAAGGVLDPRTGRFVEVVDMPSLQGFCVTEPLQRALGVPTLLEHRARLQVRGDQYFGPGRGEETFASVSTGDTLGVGILYAGNILAPDGGRSGAHMTVAEGPLLCSCGKRGCWRTIATTAWLRQTLADKGFSGDGIAADGSAGWDLPTAEAHREDPGVAEVLDRYAENLSIGLANIQQLCTPGLFILHGEAAEASDWFRERVLHHLQERSRSTGRTPRLALAKAEADEVALLGGAAMLLHQGITIQP